MQKHLNFSLFLRIISKTFIWDKNITWFVGTMFPCSGMTNKKQKFTKSNKMVLLSDLPIICSLKLLISSINNT